MPKYSQVFLADKGICARIAGALEGESFDRVVEIGPGGGALTEFLFPLYGERLRAVEIDTALLPNLKAKFPGLEIINSDFLQADIAAAAGPGRAAFISNLPYECSTAILDRVLAYPELAVAVFMFQKEVARKILAAPGDHDYGYLTLLTGARASSELLTDVKAGSFRPVPAVDSSVVVFRPRPYFGDGAQEARFRELVKKAFLHRRKTLVNSLALCGVDKARAAAAVAKAGYKPTVRPQEVDLKGFAALAADLLGGR